MAYQVLLAHGESVILPALLLIVAVCAISFWVLVATLLEKRGFMITVPAALVALLGATGVLMALASFEWPPDGSTLITLLFWAFPLLCGIVGLRRTWRDRRRGK